MNNDIKETENKEEVGGGTIQFSIKKPTGAPAKNIQPLVEETEDTLEEELLKSQAVPTEFEDVFSDSEKETEDACVAEGVVAIEEVFKQKSNMINEDFHDETGENLKQPRSKLRKAAIIVGIISGAIILAAIAVTVIILL